MRPTDKIGWNRKREAAWERAFGRAEYEYTIHYANFPVTIEAGILNAPQSDGRLERVGKASISRHTPLETR